MAARPANERLPVMNTPFEQFNLSGKTALVTGGATGLGYHMTRALARAGARVIIAARRQDVLEQAKDTLQEDPFIGDIHCATVDLGDRNSVQQLAEKIDLDFNGVDIYIGNAAGTFTEPLLDVSLQTLDDAVQSNLVANMQLAQAFLPGMKERGWGRVIFSSSIASNLVGPLEGTASYSATKAALNGYCRVIATDMGHFNITANALILGFFMTDILKAGVKHLLDSQGRQAAQKFMDDFVSCTALGRVGNPAEIEGIVQLLASNAGSYITGASMAVDGGMSIMMRPLQIVATDIETMLS
jgi:NAD(P)-dependent dehydrogenase (short-subunit alcohol dehydrogenase family)